MNVSRHTFVSGASAATFALLTACGSKGEEANVTVEEPVEDVTTTSLSFDSAAWRYDSDDDVYYQLGVSYCESPADADYKKLAVLVPGAYMIADDNGDGTYTCEIDTNGKAGSYTAATAPVVMPVNTPGYSAQSAMTEYSSKLVVSRPHLMRASAVASG